MNLAKLNNKLWLAIAAIILILLLLFPFELTVVPSWRVRIADQNGQPVAGMRVRETWIHNTFENLEHSEDLQSDAYGFVEFPRRTIKTTLLLWVTKFLMRLPNVHSGYGPSATLDYLGEYRRVSDEPLWYQPGRPLVTDIVVFKP